MHILYLDYDGVLHPDAAYWHPKRGVYLHGQPGHALFEYAAVLEAVLDPYPNLGIVLSTSWVPEMGFTRACKRLPDSLAKRVVGATFRSRHMQRRQELARFDTDAYDAGSLKLSYHTLPRGQQVWQDVLRRRSSQWLALDNDDEGWPEAERKRLVLTDDMAGLGDACAVLALQQALADFVS